MAQLCEFPGLKSPNVPMSRSDQGKQSGREASPDGFTSPAQLAWSNRKKRLKRRSPFQPLLYRLHQPGRSMMSPGPAVTSGIGVICTRLYSSESVCCPAMPSSSSSWSFWKFLTAVIVPVP